MKDIIIKACQGNPGALKVLLALNVDHQSVLVNLTNAMDLTKSESWGIWVVFKDVCSGDLDKTVDYLKRWYRTSVLPLQDYLKEKGDYK